MINITTRTLHLHTAQEVFDFICTKVIEQGRPSVKNNCCTYRGDDGDKCAAGHLITDEDYPATLLQSFGLDEPIETGSVEAFDPDQIKALGWQIDPENGRPYHMGLIRLLQVAHDMSSGLGETPTTSDEQFISRFKERARLIAQDLGLSPQVLGAA